MMIGEKIIYVTKINKLNHLREMLHIWAILYVKNECICDWYTIRSVWKVCFCLRWNLYLNDSFLSMPFLIKISQYRVIWFIFIICIIFKLCNVFNHPDVVIVDISYDKSKLFTNSLLIVSSRRWILSTISSFQFAWYGENENT